MGMGHGLARLERAAKALKVYGRAATADPMGAGACIAAGRVRESSRPDEALERYRCAAEVRPADAGARIAAAASGRGLLSTAGCMPD